MHKLPRFGRKIKQFRQMQMSYQGFVGIGIGIGSKSDSTGKNHGFRDIYRCLTFFKRKSAAVSDGRICVVLNNDLSEIGRLGSELESFASRCGLFEEDLYQLNLILEEVVANVISYAYEDNGRHEIVVCVERKDRELIMEVEDDGKPFDPLQAAPPDLGRPLEEMQVGGLGLHLVRRFTSAMQYERSEGKNRLRMIKTIA